MLPKRYAVFQGIGLTYISEGKNVPIHCSSQNMKFSELWYARHQRKTNIKQNTLWGEVESNPFLTPHK